MNEALARGEQARLLGELNEFLTIPSISALPAHAPDCRRAAEWLVDHLKGLGCPVATLLEGQDIRWSGPRAPRYQANPRC
jgi:acetylornithine deacetylase/succinyl-diaminopimelate desuccinylase-like protein